MSQSTEGTRKPSATRVADENSKMMFQRIANRALIASLFMGADRESTELHYKRSLIRIAGGSFGKCEICGNPMQVVVLNEKDFFQTVCSDTCEAARKAILLMVEEKEKGNVEKDLIDKMLPLNLVIAGRLNAFTYKNEKGDMSVKTVVITSADLADVEELGAEAMVSISHRYAGIPRIVRISSFLLGDQPAIIRSLIDQIPVSKAKCLIREENIRHARSLRSTGIAI